MQLPMRGSYARRSTELKRDELRERAHTDRPCGDFFVLSPATQGGAPAAPAGPLYSIRRKQCGCRASSLWAMQMREVVMAARRAGLIQGGLRTGSKGVQSDDTGHPPPVGNPTAAQETSGAASPGIPE